MAQYDVNWSAPISPVAGTVLVGQCLVPDVTGLYYVGTTGNRTTYGRCDGVAVTGGDAQTPVALIQTGPVPNSITGLGTGLASWVRVSTTGTLERVTTPSVGDDVVGWCETTGRMHAMFGVITAGMANGGGSAFTPPTGTGLVTVTSSALDVASRAVGAGFYTWAATPSGANLATLLTSALPATKGGTGLTSLAAGMATWWGSGTSVDLATAMTDETGSGSLVFGTAPLFKTTINLNNPGNTFKYVMTPAAIAADRILNLPLMTGTDTVSVLALAQTLTNKTIVAASNILTDTSAALGDVLRFDGTRFARLARGTANQVLTTNAGATDIAWATPASGSLGTNCSSGNTFIGIALAAGTLATAGDLRFATGAQVYMAARRSDNTDDLSLYEMDASDVCYIGGDAAFTAAKTVQQMNLEANGSITLWVGGAGQLYMEGTMVQSRVPLIGYAGANSPFDGGHGLSPKAMTGSTDVLTSAEYCNHTLKVTGTGANVVKFPAATDAAAYRKYVWNAGASTLSVQDTNAVAGATLAAGKGAEYLFSNGSVKQITSPVTPA